MSEQMVGKPEHLLQSCASAAPVHRRQERNTSKERMRVIGGSLHGCDRITCECGAKELPLRSVCPTSSTYGSSSDRPPAVNASFSVAAARRGSPPRAPGDEPAPHLEPERGSQHGGEHEPE